MCDNLPLSMTESTQAWSKITNLTCFGFQCRYLKILKQLYATNKINATIRVFLLLIFKLCKDIVSDIHNYYMYAEYHLYCEILVHFRLHCVFLDE